MTQIEQQAEAILRQKEPFGLSEVLEHLIEATEILLYQKSYDGPTYEEMELCVKVAKEIRDSIPAFIAGSKATDKDLYEVDDFLLAEAKKIDLHISFKAEDGGDRLSPKSRLNILKYLLERKATESAGVWRTDKPDKDGEYFCFLIHRNFENVDLEKDCVEFRKGKWDREFGWEIVKWLDQSASPSPSLLQQENWDGLFCCYEGSFDYDEDDPFRGFIDFLKKHYDPSDLKPIKAK